MSESLWPQLKTGTHRLLAPEETLRRITPFLGTMGITRCAALLGLDWDLGVPVYSAIRPNALVIQVGSGKGLTPIAAQVSALMEAVEVFHAEHPDRDRFQSFSIANPNEDFPLALPARDRHDQNFYWGKAQKVDWVLGESMIDAKQIWLPASAAWFLEPTQYRTCTHGLASGNHLTEATLHAFYELIERDAVSRLFSQGRLDPRKPLEVVKPETIDDPNLLPILKKINQSGSRVVLIWVPSCISVHTCWALILNPQPGHAVTRFNVGYGTHAHLNIAATRAVTEAVQGRHTLIQGAREDMIEKPVYQRNKPFHLEKSYRFFENLPPIVSWQDLQARFLPPSKDELGFMLKTLLNRLAQAGHRDIFRFNLTKPAWDISVVKVMIPSLRFTRDLF